MINETTRRTFLNTAATLPALAAPTRSTDATATEARRLVAEWRAARAATTRANAEYRTLRARGAMADVLEAAARRSDAAIAAELEALDRITAHAQAPATDRPSAVLIDGSLFVAVVGDSGEIYCQHAVPADQVMTIR